MGTLKKALTKDIIGPLRIREGAIQTFDSSHSCHWGPHEREQEPTEGEFPHHLHKDRKQQTRDRSQWVHKTTFPSSLPFLGNTYDTTIQLLLFVITVFRCKRVISCKAREKELDGLGTEPVCRLVVVPESAVRVSGHRPRPRKINLRLICCP